jgi:RecJ-like exonuclease
MRKALSLVRSAVDLLLASQAAKSPLSWEGGDQVDRPEEATAACPKCKGTGLVDVWRLHPATGEADRDVAPCHDCGGRGELS